MRRSGTSNTICIYVEGLMYKEHIEGQRGACYHEGVRVRSLGQNLLP
jgi:hypothetical protein